MVSKKTLFKMKIALVSPHFYPSTKFGGPVISLWGLCKELSSKHEIFVYTTSSGQKEINLHDNFSYKEIHKNIKCKYYSELINKYFSFYLVKNIINDLSDKDLIFIQYVFSYTSLTALLASIILNKKIVISPRGSISSYGINSKRKYLKLFWLYFFYYPFLNKITWHATSVVERDGISNYFSNSKIEIIYDGVNLKDFGCEKNKNLNMILDLLSIKNQKINKVFCSLGRLEKVKRYDLLIQAFERFIEKDKTSCLIIAGYDFGQKKILLDQIKSFNNIFLVGHLEEEEKKILLRNSNFFILTSDYESFSISTIESLASGVPVIISKNIPWQDVEENECGLVTKNDISSIVSVLERSKFVNFKPESCLNYVKSRFDWKIIANNFCKTFLS